LWLCLTGKATEPCQRVSAEPIPRQSTGLRAEYLRQLFIHVSGGILHIAGLSCPGTLILCRSTSIRTCSTNKTIPLRSMAIILTEVLRHVSSLGVRWRHYLHAQGLLVVVLACMFFFVPGRQYISRLFSRHLFSVLTSSSLRAVHVS
jgi:hypothetical protein